MTNNTDGAAQGEMQQTWRKRGVHSLLGSEPRAWLQIGDEPEHESEIVGPEWLIDQLIADHAAAERLRQATAALEQYEDLYDWAKRWQSGRRENTRLKNETPASRQGSLMALVILKAKEMNEELDSILAALAAPAPQTEADHR